MRIARRNLLLGSIAAIGADAVGGNPLGAVDSTPAYASAARLDDGGFALVLLAGDGAVVRSIPLSARGHDIAVHRQSGRAVAFARRPGTFAIAFSVRDASLPTVFGAIEGRHFFGHGAFSHDGRLLFASENDIAGARGVIGIYDTAAGYRRIGEHPSYGVGPHEIVLLGDGRTLAVANGGIDTAPVSGRENLNLGDMQPSLTFVDVESGALAARHALTRDLQSLSIRHIAADAHGAVWFGGQWEDAVDRCPSLIGSATRDRDVRLIDDADAPAASLKGYIGSVSIGAGGGVLAASAPKAGRVVYVACDTGRIVATSALRDVCGVAGVDSDAFALSSGFGVVRRETPTGRLLGEAEIAAIAFDNHLRRIG